MWTYPHLGVLQLLINSLPVNFNVKIPPHGDSCSSLSGIDVASTLCGGSISPEGTGPSRTEIPLGGAGGGRLIASCGVAATRTSAFSADRVAVLVLLAPKSYFFFLGALDPSLAHLLVVLDLSLRELAVLPEDDVEAKSENA